MNNGLRYYYYDFPPGLSALPTLVKGGFPLKEMSEKEIRDWNATIFSNII